MRPSGPELVGAFTAGVLAQGLDVIDIGLVSTDLLYFAAGRLDAPGAVFTASHNPARYNGIKMCLSGARPGRAGQRARAHPELAGGPELAPGRVARQPQRGRPARPPSPTTSAPSSTSAPCDRCASWPTPPTAWAASSCRRSSRGLPFELEVLYPGARRHVPEPPRRPDPTRRTCATCRPGSSRPAPTWGSPSTATPTGCSSSTSAVEPLSGSTTTAIVAARHCSPGTRAGP